MDVVSAGAWEAEGVGVWLDSSFCGKCCFCSFFLSFCEIFWIPLACSEVLAFIASVKFDGRETEASTIMSFRPALLDDGATALQGLFCGVNPGVKVETCGARDAAGEDEYCGR